MKAETKIKRGVNKMTKHSIAHIYIKKILTILLCLLVVFSMSNVPLYASKDAHPSKPLPRRDDPQAIHDADGLQNMRDDLDGDYFLEPEDDNIDCSELEDFEPIGSEGEPFTGTFDGRGCSISNLTIDMPNRDNVGLFGHTAEGAIIENVAILNINVTGQSQVGGLIGHADGTEVANSLIVEGTITCTERGEQTGGLIGFANGTTIAASCTSGSVTGEEVVGGLAGAFYEGTIIDTYTIANVTCNDSIAGGLIGMTDGSEISNSYAAGTGLDCNWAGGFVGFPEETEFSNNFWDTETYREELEDTADGHFEGIEGRPTAEMQIQGIFENVGWDFNNVWMMLGYPHLQIELEYGFRPITSIEELQLIGNEYPLDGNYYLANDIDASEARDWNDGGGFEPIGNEGNPFTGIFLGRDPEGNTHVIRNLFMERIIIGDRVINSGLFSHVEEAVIRDVGIINGAATLISHAFSSIIESCYTTGNGYTIASSGGLVKYACNTTITNCHTSIDIDIRANEVPMQVGGLVGEAVSSIITNCYATGNVYGGGEVPRAGGLIGVVSSGEDTITNCYATGNVYARHGRNGYLGGLVGSVHANSIITNCYATGMIDGRPFFRMGGLIGSSRGIFTNNFYNIDTTGREEATGDGDRNGITGLTIDEMLQEDTYPHREEDEDDEEGWDFNGTWFMPEGCFPHLQMERDVFNDEFSHQEIELNEDWNTISFNLMPDITTMEYLIADIEDDVIIMKDGEGNFISPGFEFYGIEKMFIENGYQIKMEDGGTLDFYGKVPKFPMTIPLKLGWNLIGYPCQVGRESARDVLQPLIDNEIEFIIKNGQGDFVNSRFNLDDLDDFRLEPNQGYWIRVNRPVDLFIPAPDEGGDED